MAAEPRQGEIWWAALPAPAGRRPVLILTRSRAIPLSPNVMVAPLTRSRKGTQGELELSKRDGLPTACSVSLENLLTISKSRLERPIAELSAENMHAVHAALRFVFEMP